MKTILLVPLLALAIPATAVAGVTMTEREIPLGGARTLAAAAPSRFDMLAVHWRGPGALLVSTRDLRGRWSGWRAADADVYPDRGSRENGLPGWRLGDLDWVGESTGARFRVRGQVTRLRAYYVESTVERTPERRLSIAGSPPIVPRGSWDANEQIRRHPPRYAPSLRFAVVHHTAGTNAYTPAQSAAIVRGIELYHVQGNGWDDIGYNFLVDRYGRIFEGRYGGVDRPVIGAHSLGFNVGSVGIAVIGDYDSTRITSAARKALVRLLAWRLDVGHIDPLSTLSDLSGGNPRFPRNIPVFLRAVSGHRDTGFTDCPGDALYAQLPGIARDVSLTGTPKLYSPKVTGAPGGLVRFTGALSGETPWTVTVTGQDGSVVAERSGTGPTLDWTWDATAAPPGRYGWEISGPSLRGANGTLGTAVGIAFAVRSATASPAFVVPAGGQPTTTVAYVLTRAATVTATVVGPAGPVEILFSGGQAAGAQSLTYTPPATLLPGDYSVQISAVSSSGATATATVRFTIATTLTAFSVVPAAISPVLGGVAGITFTLAAPAQVQVDVLQGRQVIATPAAAAFPAGVQVVPWSAALADGTSAPEGTYSVRLTVTEPSGTLVETAPVVVDSTPPTLSVVSAKLMRFRISEAATVELVVGDHVYRSRRAAGPVSFWLKRLPYAYTVVVTDAAGNSVSRLFRTG
jgi:hypothetical protein